MVVALGVGQYPQGGGHCMNIGVDQYLHTGTIWFFPLLQLAQWNQHPWWWDSLPLPSKHVHGRSGKSTCRLEWGQGVSDSPHFEKKAFNCVPICDQTASCKLVAATPFIPDGMWSAVLLQKSVLRAAISVLFSIYLTATWTKQLHPTTFSLDYSAFITIIMSKGCTYYIQSYMCMCIGEQRECL